jgi:hypothetical protein
MRHHRGGEFRRFQLASVPAIWERIWANFITPRFELFIAYGAFQAERSAILGLDDEIDLQMHLQQLFSRTSPERVLPKAVEAALALKAAADSLTSELRPLVIASAAATIAPPKMAFGGGGGGGGELSLTGLATAAAGSAEARGIRGIRGRRAKLGGGKGSSRVSPPAMQPAGTPGGSLTTATPAFQPFQPAQQQFGGAALAPPPTAPSTDAAA